MATKRGSSESSARAAAGKQIEDVIDKGQTSDVRLPSRDELERSSLAGDIKDKRRYARWLLQILIAQLAIADGVFIAYAWVGRHWRVPVPAIDAWLGATIVQIISIVVIVTRHLFPRRDTQP